MIELDITGGLGNQMFQYACARALQLKKGERILRINTNLFKSDGYGRSYSLDSCNLPSGSIEVVDRPAKLVWFLGGLANHADGFVYSLFKTFGLYIWKSRNYRIIECKGKNAVIFGYFQSEKYFKDYSDIVREELKISKPISKENQRWIDEISGTNSVCLHIRRGDYLKENLIMCDERYYRNGVEYLKNSIENPTFFVFSDDIDWVKENFKDPSFRYVDNKNSDYDELRLMYSCKHFIMSNSSFSWWAQYLSDNKGKIVIAPPKWMPTDPVSDIYMDEWVIL